ncbi:ABC transporter substrate-binding protein [Microbacterium chocolatum]|uniref:ABC transporter substrate-binding protein n=1 Tax=Microbacterium aurantiacum TaxID=162393 RepID=UPI0033901FCE
MKKTLAALGVLAAAALALSGCTDSGAAPTGAAPTSDAGDGATENRSVRVAALPIAESGALWAAIDEGIFADYGLDVEVVPAQGGAQAIPALLSGDIQFAIGQPFGPFRADLQDLGIVIIGDYANSLAEGKDVNGVVSLADSGITTPADLAGKRVSVNSLGAAGDVTIMKAVQDAGGDPTTIEFVEVAFPDAQAQLEAGNIDAAWVPDPFQSIITGPEGGNLVMHPYQETIPGLTVLTNITTADMLESDPELVADWSAAMAEALDWAMANEDAVRAAIVENMGIPEEAAAGITLPTFTSEIIVSDLEALADLAVEFGVLDALPDFDRLVQQQ